MTPQEYQGLDAVAIDALVAANEVQASELARLALQVHLETHDEINAVLEWYDEPTPPRAFASDDTPGLRGVPMLRKDYGSAEAGRLVEMGSRLAGGERATETSPYIDKLQAAGAQIIGRSAVPEFIQHGVTDSLLHGETRNPHDASMSAGGSSGGAAAAVAAGVVPVAHASDCAGSIRIPAATCGLVGLKPGRHRVPLANDWNGIAQEFVVTRSVRDARLCLAILGVGEYAPTPSEIRCAVSTEHWGGADTDPEVVAAVERVRRVFEAQGHPTQAIRQPVDYEQLMASWPTSFSQFALNDAERLATLTGRPIDDTMLEPMTLAAIKTVRALTAEDRQAGEIARNNSVHELEESMTNYDVLLTPTLGRAVIPLQGLGGHAEPSEYFERNDALFPYNYLFNLSGWPSISVPAGQTATGHPVGVQLSARIGTEPMLLDLAELITNEVGYQVTNAVR